MRPTTPTSWFLNGRNGFLTGHGDNVAVPRSKHDPISLAAQPGGPLALNSRDGSLGRLILPLGIALDERCQTYLLSGASGRIKRLEPGNDRDWPRFVSLANPLGVGTAPNCLCCPRSIAIAGGLLYVAEPYPVLLRDQREAGARIQVFDLASGELRFVWDSKVAESPLFSWCSGKEWRPVDVVARGSTAWILDRKHARVYRHDQGRSAPCQLIGWQSEQPKPKWSRIALDRQGLIYILEKRRPRVNRRADQPGYEYVLVVYEQDGRRVHQINGDEQRPLVIGDAAQVRGRFDTPPILADERDHFCVPRELATDCPRIPDPPPDILQPLPLCTGDDPESGQSWVFDREGRLAEVDPYAPLLNPFFRRQGQWLSGPLDSKIALCQWHQIKLKCARLPPGTKLVVHTYSDEVRRGMGFVRGLNESRWNQCYDFRADPQRRADDEPCAADQHEFLVHSDPGRYLWVRIKLQGDGFATPSIESIRIHYPRQSYLDDLPAVFQTDLQGRRFMENFLSVFQTEWDQLEQRIEGVLARFDPRAVSNIPQTQQEQFLNQLSDWLGVDLEDRWDTKRNGRLLNASRIVRRAPGGSARRGTLAAVRQQARVYLQNIADLTSDQMGPFPIVTEGFRQRNYLQTVASQVGDTFPLWSREVTNRTQLDSHARLGHTRLVSHGDPALDMFREHAHRFRVFFPAAWIETQEDEQTLIRGIDSEKPAHTQYTLKPFEPHIQLGIQSTLGVDTIIGGQSPLILERRDRDSWPQSRPVHPRLGVNTVLTRDEIECPASDTPSEPHPRLGIDSILRHQQEPLK